MPRAYTTTAATATTAARIRRRPLSVPNIDELSALAEFVRDPTRIRNSREG
jgi:hypothetical protein